MCSCFRTAGCSALVGGQIRAHLRHCSTQAKPVRRSLRRLNSTPKHPPRWDPERISNRLWSSGSHSLIAEPSETGYKSARTDLGTVTEEGPRLLVEWPLNTLDLSWLSVEMGTDKEEKDKDWRTSTESFLSVLEKYFLSKGRRSRVLKGPIL